MTKQVSAANQPVEPVALPIGAGSLHLAALSEPLGFQEQPAPPFAAMPEAMPPAPSRPVLPPDFGAEPGRPGLIARLLGRAK